MLFAFDLLICDGKDLRTERLLDRKQELRRLLARSLLKYTEYIEGCGTALFERVCDIDLEALLRSRNLLLTSQTESKVRGTKF